MPKVKGGIIVKVYPDNKIKVVSNPLKANGQFSGSLTVTVNCLVAPTCTSMVDSGALTITGGLFRTFTVNEYVSIVPKTQAPLVAILST